MEKMSEKHKEKFGISYEDYFRTRFNGIVELMRVLAPILDEKKALEIIKKLWEKKGINLIVRQLKNAKPISNFDEFKEVYKDQISTEYMKHCLNFKIVEDTPNKLEFKFTKCLWAKTFRESKAGDYGYAYLCYPDLFKWLPWNSKLKVRLTKTLMQGHDCCNHRLYLET